MKKALSLLLMLILCCVFFVSAQTTTSSNDESYKSVVQILAYGNIYGLHPVLRGRWSASIISNNGLILTNNHVVSDDNGKPQTSFSICMSLTTSSRPVCNRTASLIAKDEQKDIALLRIDPTDIRGNNVNYTSFRMVSLDYAYIPNPQDKTLAIWYPQVGADTITQTIWVVAGTQVYNEQTYIKTDTFIAPGNSGGPLIKDGKVIGVNTFGIGEWQSLWFALQISQAKDFIETHKDQPWITSSISSVTFQEHLATTDTVNKNKVLSDSVFKIIFLTPYVIKNYIKNNQIDAEIQAPDDINVQKFSIKTLQVDQMKTYDDFVYVLKNNYGYDPSYLKLMKKTIGGLTMYQMISNDDITQGESSQYRVYLGQYDDNTLIELFLFVPPSQDQTKQKTIKTNIDNFINGIQFTLGYVRPVVTSTQFVIPSLQLKSLPGMMINVVDTDQNAGGRFEDSKPFAKLPLDNSHETVSYFLKSNSIDEGKEQTLAQKFKTITEKIPANNKTLLSYRGNEWYGYCTTSPEDRSERYATTKNGSEVEMGVCIVELYLWEDKEYILTIKMKVEKNKLEKKQKDFIWLITKTIIPESIGDGKTNLPKNIMKKKAPGFTDAINQSTDYNKYLDLLVQYKILPKTPKAWLEDPLTYKEYLALYLKAVYNISKDMSDTVLEKTWIRWYYYVNKEKIAKLNLLIRLRMAWVSLPDYSDKTLVMFDTLADSTYRKEWEQIEQFEFNIFQGDKFGIDKAGIDPYFDYITYTSWEYDPILWVKNHKTQNTKWSLTTPLMNDLNTQVEQQVINCWSKPTMDRACINLYKKIALAAFKPWYGGYTILTRGEALTYLASEIDIALFDPIWAEKKMSWESSDTTE
jgi:hypothetical protein